MTDEERIDYLKKIKNTKARLILEVFNDKKEQIATLTPLTICDVFMGSEIIKFMTKWREFYKDSFFTKFKGSNERTFVWLQNTIIKDDNRMFFIIKDISGEIVAHIGIIFYDKSVCELDNLIKDVNCRIPGVITFTEKRIIKWLFMQIGIKKITGRLFSDNIKARSLHKKCGFKEVKEIKLSGKKVLLIELKSDYINTKINPH